MVNLAQALYKLGDIRTEKYGCQVGVLCLMTQLTSKGMADVNWLLSYHAQEEVQVTEIDDPDVISSPSQRPK